MRVIAKGWAPQEARACGVSFNPLLNTRTHAHSSFMWLETVGGHHSPLRILRPARRDLVYVWIPVRKRKRKKRRKNEKIRLKSLSNNNYSFRHPTTTTTTVVATRAADGGCGAGYSDPPVALRGGHCVRRPKGPEERHQHQGGTCRVL